MLLFEQLMTLLVAEVGHVYGGHGVRGNDLENGARIHGLQALPGLEDGKRAEQARQVERVFGMIFSHAGARG